MSMEAEYKALRGHDQVWPLVDVLRRLKAATEHALQVHGCDHHGHEGDKYAAEAADHYIALLETD